MTKDELRMFRETLEARLADLTLGNREALAIESSSDEMDRVQHFSERDYAMSHLERTSERLREVRSALSRVAAGTFGICVDCNEVIPARRLAVVPSASMCVACQEVAERAQVAVGEEMEPSFAEAD